MRGIIIGTNRVVSNTAVVMPMFNDSDIEEKNDDIDVD